MGYEKTLTEIRGINHSSVDHELSTRDIKQVIKHLPTKAQASAVLEEAQSEQTDQSATSSQSESPHTSPEDIGQVLTAIVDDIRTQAKEPATKAELDSMLGESGNEEDFDGSESDASLEMEKEMDSGSTAATNGVFLIESLVHLENKYLLTLFEGDRVSPGKGGADPKKGKAKDTVPNDAPNDGAWDLKQFS
ncbi:hypothetical protein FRC05_003868 [Tulasnella sp. 425]|nr:hypothetical protein FRC05_003868 [Tulasnella sp. 425]